MSKVEEDVPQHQPESKEQESQIPMSSSASTQAIASIGSYCLANMAMTVTNKYVFSVPCPNPLFSGVSSQYANMVFRSVGRRVQSSLYVPFSLPWMVANHFCSDVVGVTIDSLPCQSPCRQEFPRRIIPRFQRWGSKKMYTSLWNKRNLTS